VDETGTVTCESIYMLANYQHIGGVYLVLYSVFNIVIILNLVIAILASTYNQYNQYKRGLFYDTLVRAVPIYQSDKRYGSVMCAYLPFNAVMLVIAPLFFVFDKHGKTVTRLNSFI
jgi:hypothetical protein